MQVSSTMPFHFPPGHCACSHGKVGSRLDCLELQQFAGKGEWPPNSANVDPFYYHVWGVVLGHYMTKNTDGLKRVLQLIWDQLPQDSTNKVILSFTKRDQACVKGGMDT